MAQPNIATVVNYLHGIQDDVALIPNIPAADGIGALQQQFGALQQQFGNQLQAASAAFGLPSLPNNVYVDECRMQVANYLEVPF
ncbi:hypothetical protein DFP73DRAFT_632197 [Morchella snyderi]|nr:hypothetical protein DFP73DRAFT_632197 [Morchella snyderi]